MKVCAPIDVPANSGIYALRFSDASLYVGGSKNMRSRVYTHLSWLRGGHGQTKALQKAYNKQGAPDVLVLLYCAPHSLRMYEKRAHDVLRPTLCGRPIGGTIGTSFTAQARANLSASAKIRDHQQSARQLQAWRDPAIRACRLAGMARFRAGTSREQRLEWGRRAVASRRRNAKQS